MPNHKTYQVSSSSNLSALSRNLSRAIFILFLTTTFFTGIVSGSQISETTPFQPCTNQTTTDYNNESINFDSQVAPGKQLQITLKGTINIATTMTWKRFDIYQGTIKIQEDQIKVDPVEQFKKDDSYSVVYTYKFPDVIPPGEYTGQIQFIGGDQTVRGCWEFNLVFGSKLKNEILSD